MTTPKTDKPPAGQPGERNTVMRAAAQVCRLAILIVAVVVMLFTIYVLVTACLRSLGTGTRTAVSLSAAVAFAVSVIYKVGRRAIETEFAKAAILTVAVTIVAITFNAVRGKRGIELFARAPYDIYTDCPEMDENIPKLKATKIRAGKPGLVFVDARPAVVYLAGHIRGARSMPMYGSSPNAPGGIDYLSKKRGRFIVVYGRDQMQSAVHLASYLRQHGIRGVHLIEGDLAAWKKAGRKLISRAIPEVDAAELVGQSGPIFVDARPVEQYRAGHLPGARSLPCDGLIPPDKKKFAALLAKKRPIVAYGVAEVDEELAEPGADTKPKDVGKLLTAELIALGSKHVRWLPEGQKAWKKAGGKLEESPKKSEPKEPKP